MKPIVTLLVTTALALSSCQGKRTDQGAPAEFRRVVTGHSQDGTSIVISDEEAPRVVRLDSWPGFASAEIWATGPDTKVPAGGSDPTLKLTEFLPDAGGSRVRIVRFPPASPRDGEAFWEEYQQQAPDLAQAHEKDGMHTTDTVDYGFVLSGEIMLELDNDQKVQLRQGDCIVQNGTRHSWTNNSSTPCVMAFVMIGASRRQPE